MRLAVAIAGVLAAQWAFFSRAAVGCAAPDLPVAFALYLGLRAQGRLPLTGLWALGLAVDLLGPYPTGLHALTFLALGFAGATAGKRFDPASLPVRAALLAGGTAALRAVQLLALAFEGAAPALPRACHFVWTSALMNVVAGVCVFALFDFIAGHARVPRGDFGPAQA